MKKNLLLIGLVISVNMMFAQTATVSVGTINGPAPGIVDVPVIIKELDNPLTGNNLVSSLGFFIAYDAAVLGNTVQFIYPSPALFPGAVTNVIQNYPQPGWNTISFVDAAAVSTNVIVPETVITLRFTYTSGSTNLNWVDYLNFTNIITDDEGNEFFLTLINGSVLPAPGPTLNLKVFLEGPYYSGQMTPFLNVLGHLPTNQPYNTAPWNYAGTESVTSFPSPDIVDWVLVDVLKPHTDGNQIRFEVMGRKAGFLFKDGFIKDIDGASNLNVETNMTSDFYIRIHHRNHLSVISAVPLAETNGVFSYDFTLSANQALGGTLVQKQLSSVIWGMIAADANASGQIDNRDKNEVWLPQLGLTGYYEGDFNMDTQVDNDDKIVKWEPNAGKSSYPVKDTLVGGLPVISTENVSDITGTTAICGGNVIEDSGYAVTARGVCWSIVQSPTISDAHTSDGAGTGTFVSQITGLITVMPYYVRAYATNSYGTTYGNELLFSTTWEPCPTVPTITYEGQNYNTVQIGNQCWLNENLNVGVQGTQTNNGIIEKYCYNNDTSNCSEYGGLYQWSEMMQYNPQLRSQGICPTGWHIPAWNEWSILITHLGGTEIAGSKMKETGTSHWAPPNTDATNESGFTALPICGDGYQGIFWTSNQNLSPQKNFYHPIYIQMHNSDGYIYPQESYAGYGEKPVRCIKNYNGSPRLPTNPTPLNNSLNQSRNTILIWDCSDPENDPISFDVYFGSSNPPNLVSTDQSETIFNPSELLLPSTTYYWKIVAYDTLNQITSGPIWSFTTQIDGLPIVTTEIVSNIEITTAIGGGNVIEQGNSSVISRGVCWSLSQNPTISDNLSVNGSGTGNFISQITGLFPSSHYYICAYAATTEGTGYGPQVEFTTNWVSCPGTPTISYEGQTYNTVKIGSQCWLKENLNVGESAMPLNDGVIQKYCYNNNPLDCDIYGGLYNWHELMQYNYQSAGKGICPEGWHVPADSDWQTLMDTLGDWQIGASKVTETGTLHWSPPNTNATNESGFTGLPGGFLDLAAHDDFFSLHSGAFFSSSSSENRFGALYNSYFYLQNRILVGGSSVRCIKNSN